MERFAEQPPMGPHFAALGNGSVTDKVTPDMAHLIHPYWNQFPAMDPIWSKILAAYLLTIGILAWIGNGTVIYIFGTTKSLRTPANLLVINLALSDFGMMVLNTPIMGINLYFETWVWGPLMCDVYAGLGSAFWLQFNLVHVHGGLGSLQCHCQGYGRTTDDGEIGHI